jgi:protein-tyrosine phosphatase
MLANDRGMDKLTYTVEPGLLYGRPGPNKSRWDLDALKRRGLAVVVSLVNIEDPKCVARAGLKHYVIPFEDKIYLPYKSANGFVLEIFDRFDGVLDLHLPRREPVLVHCNAGKDRTGLLLTYYLVSRKGLSAKRALKFLRKLNPDALSASGYEEVLFALEPEMINRRNRDVRIERIIEELDCDTSKDEISKFRQRTCE